MQLIVVENECVMCDLPCLYKACPYWAVAHFYCDKCKDEYEVLYWYDGEQLCEDCVLSRLERVEYNGEEQ